MRALSDDGPIRSAVKSKMWAERPTAGSTTHAHAEPARPRPMDRKLLEMPSDPAQIRQRKGRNGVLDYVEGHRVIARLNEALDAACYLGHTELSALRPP